MALVTRPPAGDVAKWPKAVVCKTTIRRFKSARRLHLLPVLAVLAACDPPPPPPVPSAAASNAAYVRWRSPDEPVRRPVALFVDHPGGIADRVAADFDVTTFLNDRFHPVILPPEPGGPSGTVQFLTVAGCPLTAPFAPSSPTQWIEVANRVVKRPEAAAGWAPRLSLSCPEGR